MVKGVRPRARQGRFVQPAEREVVGFSELHFARQRQISQKEKKNILRVNKK